MNFRAAVAREGTSRQRGRRSTALYEPLGWLVVRAPALPIEAYVEPPSAGDPLVRTALAVASPDLLEQLERQARAAGPERGAGKLLRYLIRMSTRPTPFGLFAGVGLAQFGGTTDLQISASRPRTRMRPDMAWLLAFVAQLEERPEIRGALRVTTNPAAWVHAGRALLAERVPLDGSGEFGPVGIRATGAVRSALELARNSIGWGELATRLLSSRGATEEKVQALLTQLWQQTFLLTELRPPLTHPAPARYVEERLARVPAARAEHAMLAGLLTDMSNWDELDLANRPAALRALAPKATVAVPNFKGVPVQVDAGLALDGTQLAASVAQAAARAAEILLRLSAPPAAHLDGYRQSFVNRYGVDREVPLLELLDPVRGLGPPMPTFPAAVHAKKTALRHATLRQLAVDALRDRRIAVELDDAMMDRLEQTSLDTTTAPPSIDLSVFVLAASAAEVDAGNFRLVVGPNLGAQSAGRNLGRFADLLGAPAAEALAAVTAAEVELGPGDLHAEVVYLPRSGRSANVAIRPSGYPYEVIADTTSNVDQSHAIPLSELLVGVGNGRFFVRWPAAPGDLHVHAGHMLTSLAAPVAVRFLEDVTRGERLPLTAFHWGPAGDLPFLPRIEIGQIVLCPAQWQVDALLRDTSLPPDDDCFPELLARWRDTWRVPRQVYLTVADNRLLLDLALPAHVEQLRAELRRVGDERVLLLQEPLPGPEHAWLEGPTGRHLPEFVIPLVRRRTTRTDVATPEPPRTNATARQEDRLRLPGSDWLYAKLYGPADGQDELLADAVRGFGEFAIGSGLAERWFFLRYADPEPHLRVRFGGEPDRLIGDLLPRICAWAGDLIAAGACSSLSFDTYDREVERYGGLSAIGTAEEIFSVDSATVVELLHLLRVEQTSLDRTTLAVLSVDALLAALGRDVAGRLALYRESVPSRHETGVDYRRRQRDLRKLLGRQDGVGLIEERHVARVLRARHAALGPLADRLHAYDVSGELTKPLAAIYPSLVHVHCNRLLGAQPPTERHVLGLLLRTREGLERAPTG